MQIKISMVCHPAHVRMAIINKSTNNKCWQGCGEKGNLVHCCWECRLEKPLWKKLWSFLKKLKMYLPYHLDNSTSGDLSKETKTLIWNYLCTPMFIAALITIAKIQKQVIAHHNERIKNQRCIYIMGYYSTIKKSEILPCTTTLMDYRVLCLVQQVSQRKTNTLWFHLYVESKEQNYWTNKIKTESDNREQTTICQVRRGLGDWVKEVKGLRSINWQL